VPVVEVVVVAGVEVVTTVAVPLLVPLPRPKEGVVAIEDADVVVVVAGVTPTDAGVVDAAVLVDAAASTGVTPRAMAVVVQTTANQSLGVGWSPPPPTPPDQANDCALLDH
jgi:hypothetical protein